MFFCPQVWNTDWVKHCILYIDGGRWNETEGTSKEDLKEDKNSFSRHKRVHSGESTREQLRG